MEPPRSALSWYRGVSAILASGSTPCQGFLLRDTNGDFPSLLSPLPAPNLKRAFFYLLLITFVEVSGLRGFFGVFSENLLGKL